MIVSGTILSKGQASTQGLPSVTGLIVCHIDQAGGPPPIENLHNNWQSFSIFEVR